MIKTYKCYKGKCKGQSSTGVFLNCYPPEKELLKLHKLIMDRRKEFVIYSILPDLEKDIIKLRYALNSLLKQKAIKSKYYSFSSEELRTHLEKRFTPKMNWDNYGTYWNIDHIVPINEFKQGRAPFEQVFCLSNIRPCLVVTNRKKGVKIN